jgi:hypothetical protein
LLSRDKKADERWAVLLKRQEEKMELKKRRDDMSLLRASIEGMYPGSGWRTTSLKVRSSMT